MPLDTVTRPSRDAEDEQDVARETQQRFARHAAEMVLGETPLHLPHSPHNTMELRAQRAEQMRRLYEDHWWTLQSIGDAYGMTREAVRQIFDGFSIARRPKYWRMQKPKA